MIAWLLTGLASRAGPYIAGAVLIGALVMWGTVERQRAAHARADATAASQRADTLAAAHGHLYALYSLSEQASARHAAELNTLRQQHDHDATTLAHLPADACLDAVLPAAARQLLDGTAADAKPAAAARQPAAAPGG